MNGSTNGTPESSSGESSGTAQVGVKYLASVGVLLVVVIALLAVLWMKERSARVAARMDAAQWEDNCNRLRGAVGELLIREGGQRIQPVQRDDLPIKEVDLDGQRRMILQIGPSAGRRLGFLPGDLILVGEEAPKTRPANRER